MRTRRNHQITTYLVRLALVALLGLVALVAASGLARAQTPTLTVTPPSDSNPVGTTHTLEAFVSPAAAGQIVRLEVLIGPNIGATDAAATDSAGRATLTYVGAGGLGEDAILVWLDLDFDGTFDGGEPVQVATKTWTAVASGTLVSLEPQSDTNLINTSHQLTGTVSPAQSGVIVRFVVTAGPNAGDKLVDTTNSNGVAAVSYVGDGGVGVDVIVAWADVDGDNVQDGDEPALNAIKTWTTAVGEALDVTPSADTNPVGTKHVLTATLTPAQNNVRIRFEVLSGPNDGITRRDRTNSSGVAQVDYTGTGGTGTDTIIAWADFDDNGNRDGGEPADIVTKTWTSTGPVTTVTLTPVSDTNPVGSTHTLTWTVSPAQSGIRVRFEVTSGPNDGVTRNELTNSSGVATDSYTGSGGAGVDTIVGWADLDNDGRRDSNEPSSVATKTWTGTGTVTRLTLAPADDSNPVGASHTLTATVSPAQSGVSVRFEVVSGPHDGLTRSDSTNSSGVARVSYTGSNSGTDTIVAWADLDRDGRRDAGEPSAVATKTWDAAVLGTFISGVIPSSGFGLIVWGGGSSDLLASASGCGSLIPSLRFWATEVIGNTGEFVVYIPASQVSAVNARWFALFPGGIVPSGTVMLATCGG